MMIQKSLETLKVLTRCIGVWEGKWVCLDSDSNIFKKFNSLITQKIIDNQLIQTNKNTYDDGTTETINFVATLRDDGTIEVRSPNPPYCNFTMLVKECFDNLIILESWEQTTGMLLAVEIFHFVSSTKRVRTLQHFESEEGKLVGFSHVVEHRVG